MIKSDTRPRSTPRTTRRRLWATRHVEDANGDGRVDLVLHFRLGDTGFTCADIPQGAKDVTLTARLTGFAEGIGIDGEDSIRLVRQ